MIPETKLRSLANKNINEFLKIMTRDSSTLSSCAEILGEEVKEESIVIKILKPLLKHVHAGVREGALNGLLSFYDGKKLPIDIVEIVKQISQTDPSAILKECAKNILTEFGETNR